ncbi:MAG: DNA-protecting protein DprA [Candidatus Omnitrophica bacterium]|nr:DNA-protecting protein DprA [Candidatus Omnitrophota bacterium]
MDDLEAILLLNTCPKMHLRKLQEYLERYGSLQAIIQKDPQIKQRCQSFDLTDEFREIQQRNVKIISFMDERYPSRLKEIADPPLILYARGEVSLLKEEKAIAFVGARKATPYGLKLAGQWSGEIASYGMTIVSGLALGIDGAAHEGALKKGGKTIAILGSGLAELYPLQHRPLAERIARDGLILSEFPMGTEPWPQHFPRRNRLISGLSLGVVVIEAGERSGALVTASAALEQGRDVFALPGRVDSPLSIGTNRLIKDGARVALSAREILEELSLPILQSCPESEPEKEQNPILDLLSEGPVPLEELVKRLDRPVAQLTSELALLEIAGKVIQLPGPCFAKP